MRRPSAIAAIALTVFIDILGFGLVIPDIQLRGESLGAKGVLLGLTIASFSLAQLVTAPFLGRWSDVVGRRKILLITSTLSMCSYLVYSHAFFLWVMVLARVLNGIGGANIGVAYAFIADETTPEKRGSSMGLIGAAFGMGFIFGPGMGSFLVKLGHGSPEILGYTSAALCAVNLAFIYFVLPESLHKGTHAGADRTPSFTNLARALRAPGMGLLLAMFFATNFGFSNMESTFFRLAEHDFNLDQLLTALVLTWVGVVSAIMQGGIIRLVLPIFGEVNLLRCAYFLQVPALLVMPWAHPWIPILLVAAVLGVGGGLSQPSMSSLISLTAPASLQGGIFGVTQSLGAAARVLGPLVGNTLFDVRHWLPYVFGAGVVFLPLLGSWRLKMPKSDQDGPQESHEDRRNGKLSPQFVEYAEGDSGTVRRI